jgi:hypothetical protein
MLEMQNKIEDYLLVKNQPQISPINTDGTDSVPPLSQDSLTYLNLSAPLREILIGLNIAGNIRICLKLSSNYGLRLQALHNKILSQSIDCRPAYPLRKSVKSVTISSLVSRSFHQEFYSLLQEVPDLWWPSLPDLPENL